MALYSLELPFAVTSLLASSSFSVPLGPIFYFVLCVEVFCLSVFMCTLYVPGSFVGQKRLFDSLEL